MHGEGLRNPVWSKTITDDVGREFKWGAGTLPDGSLVFERVNPVSGITVVDVLEKVVREEAT